MLAYGIFEKLDRQIKSRKLCCSFRMAIKKTGIFEFCLLFISLSPCFIAHIAYGYAAFL